MGDDIVLTIVAVGKDKVRIGVKAPPGIRILRNELEGGTAEVTVPFPAPASKPKAGPPIPTPNRRAA